MENLIHVIIEEEFSKEKKWRTELEIAKDGNRSTL